jgi:hypothetical protein
MAACLALALVLTAGLRADDKEVTLKGTLCCAKCILKEADKCTNAIKVKEDGKDVVYLLDDKGAKEKYHKEICQSEKEGSVKGTVSTKDGKKYIKPSKDGVKFN